jgi:hypothetical protein
MVYKEVKRFLCLVPERMRCLVGPEQMMASSFLVVVQRSWWLVVAPPR